MTQQAQSGLAFEAVITFSISGKFDEFDRTTALAALNIYGSRFFGLKTVEHATSSPSTGHRNLRRPSHVRLWLSLPDANLSRYSRVYAIPCYNSSLKLQELVV